MCYHPAMNGSRSAADSEVIIGRLRRLATIWRVTYIFQMILLMLLTIAVALEVSLPGVLVLLLRSEVGAQLLIPCILVPLLALDPVAATVELRMGRQLRAKRTPLRRLLTVLYMVPGVMLFRRSLLVLLADLWLNIIIVGLVVWIVGMVTVSLLMVVTEPVGIAFGQAVDAVDRLLNGAYSRLRKTLREIALSPASEIESDDNITIPLIAAQLDVGSGQAV